MAALVTSTRPSAISDLQENELLGLLHSQHMEHDLKQMFAQPMKHTPVTALSLKTSGHRRLHTKRLYEHHPQMNTKLIMAQYMPLRLHNFHMTLEAWTQVPNGSAM